MWRKRVADPSEHSKMISSGHKTPTEDSIDPTNDSFLSKRKPKKVLDTLNYTKETFDPQNTADVEKLTEWAEEHYEMHIKLPLDNRNPPFFFEC